MTTTSTIPTTTGDTVSALPPATEDTTAALTTQTQGLRHLADLLDQLGEPGLLVTTSDWTSVQVPTRLGDTERRAQIVHRLAGMLGTRARHRHNDSGPGWLVADSDLAGHRVHVHTTIGNDIIDEQENTQ